MTQLNPYLPCVWDACDPEHFETREQVKEHCLLEGYPFPEEWHNLK